MDDRTKLALRAALGTSAVLLALRLFASERLGWGESEALYASYAFYPQAMYVDHPGLIGVIARAIGDGSAPTPEAAHRVTSVLSLLVPWTAAAAARALGASVRGAAVTALALLLVPETSIGLFGLTPDLPLALGSYAALGLVGSALAAPPRSTVAFAATLLAGLAAGFAAWGKVSGLLLVAGLAAAFATPRLRARLGVVAPVAALGVACVVIAPSVFEEIARGFPMLRHRLVDTQRGAGPSLTNAARLVLGQLAYVGPPALLAAWLVARDLWRRRAEDPESTLLATTTLAQLPLVLLAIVSPVSEPHWVGPLFLPLPLHLARAAERSAPLVSTRLSRATIAWGAFALAVVHVAVLTPALPVALGGAYPAKADLTNDLYAWKEGLALVREQLAQLDADGERPIVVGPHWTVCAQLRAGLPRDVIVGCDGDAQADFATWVPRSAWSLAPHLLYVTDDRFDVDPPRALAAHAVAGIARTSVRRGGVVVRRIGAFHLARHTRADAAAP